MQDSPDFIQRLGSSFSNKFLNSGEPSVMNKPAPKQKKKPLHQTLKPIEIIETNNLGANSEENEKI